MRLLSAMTVGSLRMMPLRARVDERVRRTEIDREIARQGVSLHSAGRRRRADGSGASARRSRSNSSMLCSIEFGRRLRSRMAVMPTTLREDREQQECHVGFLDLAGSRCRRRIGDTGRIGCSPSAQSEPPPSAPASRSARSPSACRCSSAPRRTRRRGAATRRRPRPTAPTASSSPTRCSSATRSRSGQRRRASATISAIARRAGLFVGLVGHRARRRRGPRRDRARRRRSVTTAPGAASSPTRAARRRAARRR